MADEDEKDDGGAPWRLKPWQGRLLAILLVVAGAVHAFKPAWLTLDWPTIALILSGVLLLFVPLEDVGSVIESLEFGKTKITLRKVKQLDQTVERALNSGIATAAIPVPMDNPEDEDEPAATGPPSPARTPRSAWGDFFEDPRNRTLWVTDPDMMLVRLGIEIERVLAQLAPERVQGTVRPMVWSQAVKKLEQENIITPQIARALIEFRDVRNRLIHPTGGSVTDAMVASAVDSGIKLLRLLNGLRDMNRKA